MLKCHMSVVHKTLRRDASSPPSTRRPSSAPPPRRTPVSAPQPTPNQEGAQAREQALQQDLARERETARTFKERLAATEATLRALECEHADALQRTDRREVALGSRIRELNALLGAAEAIIASKTGRAAPDGEGSLLTQAKARKR